jgi:hypothetical protein
MDMVVKMSPGVPRANAAARHIVGFALTVKITVKFATIVADVARGRFPSGISIATEL